ncbi:MAG: hypothetical protein GY835_22880, partial [bacterium]|nr:hypothetical protein [bacterium]
MNPTGTKDAAFDCLLPHRMKKVNVTVQSEQSVMTSMGQQEPKLVRAAVPLTITDVRPGHAVRLVMARNAPGFLPGTQVCTNAGDAGGQLVRDRARLVKVTSDLHQEMRLLPPDYLAGINGTDRKPALYLTVRVVKFLEEYRPLFVNTNKEEGSVRVLPYHPNAQPLNPDMQGTPLDIEEGAYCHYPDAVQRELQLHPFADHTNGPWAVVIGLGTMTHYTGAFCMQSLNQTITSWPDYSNGRLDGDPHMRLPEELAELLTGEYATVVVQSQKTMIALYRTFGLR